MKKPTKNTKKRSIKKRHRTRGTSRRAGRRPTTSKAAPAGVEKGYDFGVPVHVMATSLPTFVDDLRQAKVMACAYGGQAYGDLGLLPVIGLVARNSAKLENALIDLEKRAKPLGGDAVGVGILFQPSGGFRISISIDPEDLTLRLFPGNYLHSPLAVAVSWLYDLKSTHPQLPEIRRWKEKNPLFPVLLGGATQSASGKPQRVGSLVPVFNMEFAENTTGASATLFPSLGIVAHGTRKERGPEKYSAQELRNRRLKVLARYFPMTCRRTGTLGASLDDAAWERLQAMCNLTVSRELTAVPFYVGIAGDAISGAIESYLRSRVETRPIEPSTFSDAEIDRQVTLDRASREAYVNS